MCMMIRCRTKKSKDNKRRDKRRDKRQQKTTKDDKRQQRTTKDNKGQQRTIKDNKGQQSTKYNKGQTNNKGQNKTKYKRQQQSRRIQTWSLVSSSVISMPDIFWTTSLRTRRSKLFPALSWLPTYCSNPARSTGYFRKMLPQNEASDASQGERFVSSAWKEW